MSTKLNVKVTFTDPNQSKRCHDIFYKHGGFPLGSGPHDVEMSVDVDKIEGLLQELDSAGFKVFEKRSWFDSW